MPEMPPAPATSPEPSQHFHITAQHVVIPLDYFLRLVDAAARAKYAPPPLPSTAAKQSENPVDRIAGGTMKPPSPALHVPGTDWEPKGVAASGKNA